jgi:hypothetical protein
MEIGASEILRDGGQIESVLVYPLSRVFAEDIFPRTRESEERKASGGKDRERKRGTLMSVEIHDIVEHLEHRRSSRGEIKSRQTKR